MCTRLKNWDKGEVHRAVIVQFCDKYAYTLYFKKLHEYCVYSEKKPLIYRRLYFELNNKIIQLSILILDTGSELYSQLIFQSSTVTPQVLC